jgi:hypothetical protein
MMLRAWFSRKQDPIDADMVFEGKRNSLRN